MNRIILSYDPQGIINMLIGCPNCGDGPTYIVDTGDTWAGSVGGVDFYAKTYHCEKCDSDYLENYDRFIGLHLELFRLQGRPPRELTAEQVGDAFAAYNLPMPKMPK
jgi:hypothetical protein